MFFLLYIISKLFNDTAESYSNAIVKVENEEYAKKHNHTFYKDKRGDLFDTQTGHKIRRELDLEASKKYDIHRFLITDLVTKEVYPERYKVFLTKYDKEESYMLSELPRQIINLYNEKRKIKKDGYYTNGDDSYRIISNDRYKETRNIAYYYCDNIKDTMYDNAYFEYNNNINLNTGDSKNRFEYHYNYMEIYELLVYLGYNPRLLTDEEIFKYNYEKDNVFGNKIFATTEQKKNYEELCKKYNLPIK